MVENLKSPCGHEGAQVISVEGDRATIMCPQCHGTGFLYSVPLERVLKYNGNTTATGGEE